MLKKILVFIGDSQPEGARLNQLWFNTTNDKWNKCITIEPVTFIEISSGSGGAVSGDLDGGAPDSIYGGTDPVDGGTP